MDAARSTCWRHRRRHVIFFLCVPLSVRRVVVKVAFERVCLLMCFYVSNRSLVVGALSGRRTVRAQSRAEQAMAGGEIPGAGVGFTTRAPRTAGGAATAVLRRRGVGSASGSARSGLRRRSRVRSSAGGSSTAPRFHMRADSDAETGACVRVCVRVRVCLCVCACLFVAL